MKTKVLIIDDEQTLITMIRYNLEKEGFDVFEASNGEEAFIVAEETLPDVIVLDWMLPRVSGIEVCRRFRRKSATREIPILMLTARGEESDKVRGLEVGADDYMTKPFSLAEMIARINALLRRSKPVQTKGQLSYGDIVMDLAAHRTSRAGDFIHLGPIEYKLLKFLMEHPGTVYSREELLNAVWGPDIYVEPRTVDVHIRRLRKALNQEGKEDFIRTVRSAGYALDVRGAGSFRQD
mgnify:CR=1 FL=1